MKQVISKNKKVMCTTSVPYPKEIVNSMKKAGYKVKEIEDETQTENSKSNNN